MPDNRLEVRAREVFSEALTRASREDRERYLVGACGNDGDLRCQVDSLLSAHAEAGEFLQQNVLTPGGPAIGEKPGDVIGRYKLLQQIGEGGFGIVFMAEQREPIRRLVAVKIIKAGMDTKEVVARLEAERQALALMDHPNIARVLDGGATASGRPYFVMDLVKGVPITEFCERHQLSVDARLHLFMQVCAGVQHAHQKGVIHRDLKPNNVLVIHEPGQPGVPRVIDFGIAKAIGQKLTERTLFTRFEQLIGTPAYMSPEQAEWSGRDVDTRSDLYSLGVLLYEMLTGTTPLEKETLDCAALDEVRRMIREVEPPRPSTRLRDAQVVAGRNESLGSRRAKRKGPIDPDLDWIVMKALEKDRSRRYETVNGLARDIERHLNGEPVTACPPSKAYQARKFIRKHRVVVTASAAVALALVIGLGLALVGLARARQADVLAAQETAVSKAVNDFLLHDLLGQASPRSNPDRDVKLREILDRAAAKVGGQFTNRPLVEAAIRLTLGSTYLALGELDAAEPHLQQAIELQRSAPLPNLSDRFAAERALADLRRKQRRFAEAETMLQRVLEETSATFGLDDPLTAQTRRDLGVVYFGSGRLDKAESLYRQALDTQRRSLGADHPATLDTMSCLANLYTNSGRNLEALDMDEELWTASRRSLGPEHPDTLALLYKLAWDHFTAADYQKAVTLYRELLQTGSRVLGSKDEAMRLAELHAANAEASVGNWVECIELCRGVFLTTTDPQHASHAAYQGAVAALLAGQTNVYREFAAELLSRSVDTADADLARMAVEVCGLVKDSVSDREALSAMADLALKADPVVWPMNRLAKGMAEYRRGNMAQALQWLEGPRQCACSSAASQAGYFCAMIHHCRGDLPRAKAAMDDAAHRLVFFLKPGEFGDRWHEYGRVVVVRAEAERLIFGREITPRVTAAEVESARRRWAPVKERLQAANRLAGQQKWAEARDAYLAALREPVFDVESADNTEFALEQKMGVTFLLAGDPGSHGELCRRWFSYLERYPDSQVACRLAKAALIREMPPTNEWVMVARRWSAEFEDYPEHVHFARILTSYRAGQFQEAIEASNAAADSKHLTARAGAQIYRALSLAKLGQAEAARHELQQAQSNLAANLVTFTGDFWWDLALCQLALDEAHRVLGDAPLTTNASKAQAR